MLRKMPDSTKVWGNLAPGYRFSFLPDSEFQLSFSLPPPVKQENIYRISRFQMHEREALALQHMLQKGCLSDTMQESEIHPSNDQMHMAPS
jgi:hypothetical protein